jgi:hypothetical protein
MTNSQATGISQNPRFWLWVALLLLPFMPSHDSLWIDEGDTAMYAVLPGFGAWWHHLRLDEAADCQMPLSMLFAWIGGKLLGVSEWQMRAVNLLWGIFAVAGMYRVGRRLELPWLPLLLAIQPYFWFYMNEARGYALEIACGTWLLVAFVEFLQLRAAGTSWAWLLVVSVLFLFLSTLLAPVPVAAVVVAGVITAVRNGWRPDRKAWLILLTGGAANLPTAIYYLSTLLRGVKSAMVWKVNLTVFGYVLYELTGMSGLGLPIAEIRTLAKSSQGLNALTADWLHFVLPAAGFFLLLAVIILGLGRRADANPPGVCEGLAIVVGLTACAFVVASVVFQKALWARHLAPVFPFYVSLLGLAIASLLKTRNRVLKGMLCLLVGLLFFSALNLRLAPSWRKDDYRSAAAFANDALARGHSVWWDAADCGAIYYHVPLTTNPDSAKAAYLLTNPTRESIASVALPDVIVASKPDLFDSRGTVAEIAAQRDYKKVAVLPAFVIWEKADHQTP